MNQNEFEAHLFALTEVIARLKFDISRVPERASALDGPEIIAERIQALEKRLVDRRVELAKLIKDNMEFLT